MNKQVDENAVWDLLEGKKIPIIQDNSNKENQDVTSVDVFKHALDAIIVFTDEGEIVDTNPAFCSIMGEEKRRLIGKNLKELVPGDKHYKLNRQKALLQQNKEAKGILPIYSSKGITYFDSVTTIDPDTSLNLSIMRDITHHKLMEEQAERNTNLTKELFLEALDGIILWDPSGNVLTANSAACQIFESPHHRLIGQNYKSIITIEENKFHDIIQEIRKTGAVKSHILINLLDGKKKYIEFSCKKHSYDSYTITIFRDISEKVRMQEQLSKSDRLNVIGELAAGIAHEIRNPMTALKGFIQLLENSIKKEHSMYYQVITSELARIDSIINEFLILAKPQAIRFQEKDVNQILRETVELLNAQAVLYNVQFFTQYDDRLPHLYCEANQLKKVFINIIKNAIEVMPDGGMITVSTNSIKDRKIHISIQDEGIGIPKERIKKLGEPFYTTKERGTGLGLMVSYKIIEEHQGTIEIESEEGKGTKFHIYLPLDIKYRT